MRWFAMAFCFALAAVTAYWAYGAFDAISSPDNDASNGILIVAGGVFSMASLGALISGVGLVVLWPWRRRSL
jgi:hypothetical protein